MEHKEEHQNYSGVTDFLSDVFLKIKKALTSERWVKWVAKVELDQCTSPYKYCYKCFDVNTGKWIRCILAPRKHGYILSVVDGFLVVEHLQNGKNYIYRVPTKYMHCIQLRGPHGGKLCKIALDAIIADPSTLYKVINKDAVVYQAPTNSTQSQLNNSEASNVTNLPPYVIKENYPVVTPPSSQPQKKRTKHKGSFNMLPILLGVGVIALILLRRK